MRVDLNGKVLIFGVVFWYFGCWLWCGGCFLLVIDIIYENVLDKDNLVVW